MVTTRDVSCVTPPDVTRHTYSPESAAVTWGMRRRVPDTSEGTIWGEVSAGEQGTGQIQGDPPSAPYLVAGGQGAAALVPRHGGGAGSCHQAVEVQGLSLGDGWG